MSIPKAWLIGMIEELDERLELYLKLYKVVKNKPIPAPLEEEKKKAENEIEALILLRKRIQTYLFKKYGVTIENKWEDLL